MLHKSKNQLTNLWQYNRPTRHTKNNKEDSSLRAIAISCIEPAEELQNIAA
jgi:hypothetical protein